MTLQPRDTIGALRQGLRLACLAAVSFAIAGCSDRSGQSGQSQYQDKNLPVVLYKDSGNVPIHDYSQRIRATPPPERQMPAMDLQAVAAIQVRNLIDNPQCYQYRDALLLAGKGSAYDSKALMAMNNTLAAAGAIGCINAPTPRQ